MVIINEMAYPEAQTRSQDLLCAEMMDCAADQEGTALNGERALNRSGLPELALQSGGF